MGLKSSLKNFSEYLSIGGAYSSIYINVIVIFAISFLNGIKIGGYALLFLFIWFLYLFGLILEIPSYFNPKSCIFRK